VKPQRFLMGLLFLATMTSLAPSVYSQTSDDTARIATRAQLEQLLDTFGPNIKVSFRRSEKQPFNYVGTLKDGLTNCDSLEIVAVVSSKQTISFLIYPHYKGVYLNVDKAKNSVGFMRQLMRFNDNNFLFWGMDSSADVFAGYTFTLESGFPDAAVKIVLRSIANLDKFVGEMKPMVDGSSAL
jgi:hypothetical protein